MEAISRSCLPEAAARTKRQRKATCCGVLGAASHRTTCSRSSAAKLTSGLILAMRTHISYWPQYVYLFMIHTTRDVEHRCRLQLRDVVNDEAVRTVAEAAREVYIRARPSCRILCNAKMEEASLVNPCVRWIVQIP